MINRIWVFLLLISVLTLAWQGRIEATTQVITVQAQQAVQTSLGLIGIMAFWLGMMRLAEKSGLLRVLSRALRPAARLLFPELPPESEAFGTILMNMGANLLGLGNVATPLGLKAMTKLQELNNNKQIASSAMCTLLALNTSGLTLVPTTVIALRVAAGSTTPTEIVGTTLVATFCSTCVALAVDRWFRLKEGSSSE